MSRFKEHEGAPLDISRVLNKAAPLVPTEGSHLYQIVRELQKVCDVAWDEALLQVRCVIRHDDCPIAEMEALKLSYLANKLTGMCFAISCLLW